MSAPIREFQAAWWDLKAALRADFPPYRWAHRLVRWLATLGLQSLFFGFWP